MPTYKTSSIEQVARALSGAEVSLVIIETVSVAEIVHAATERGGCHRVTVLSPDSEAIETFVVESTGIPHTQVVVRTDALGKDDIVTIVYIPKTTGIPKGAVLTHEDSTSLCLNAHAWMPGIAAGKDSCPLLFLLLAHVLTRFLQVFQVGDNGILVHIPNIKNLLPDLASFKPFYLLIVPHALEKIYSPADAKASKGTRRIVFRQAAHMTIGYSEVLDTAGGPSRLLRTRRALAGKPVHQNIVKLVGGNMRYIVSGDTPSATWLGHPYRRLDVPVLGGYGLTEAVGPVSVNTPSLSKIGTMSPTLPPMFFKVSDEGGILPGGPSVSHGYNSDSGAGAACFTEGEWLKTGDLDSLDRGGYVWITGRVKETIVTTGNKNVAPALLENPIYSHPLVSQVLIVGDQRPLVSATITLGAEMLPMWSGSHGLPPMSVVDAGASVEIPTSLQKAVGSANAHISRVESIRKFMVLTSNLAEANGVLTSSLRVKRGGAVLCLAPIIDEPYSGPVQA